MRTLIVILSSSLLAVTALADTPAPAGLDRLATVLPGTWKTEGQTLDSVFTKAGPQHYVTQRDCWREKDSFKCVSVVNGTLQLYDIFSWDAPNGSYHETQITPKGRQPDFNISVKGDIWTSDQDITRPDNSVMHYRIVRSYTSATSAEYIYEYSSDGKEWSQIAKGTETKLP